MTAVWLVLIVAAFAAGAFSWKKLGGKATQEVNLAEQASVALEQRLQERAKKL